MSLSSDLSCAILSLNKVKKLLIWCSVVGLECVNCRAKPCCLSAGIFELCFINCSQEWGLAESEVKFQHIEEF